MNSDPQRQRRALALFEGALDQPEAERDAWVVRASGSPETAAAVRRLLRADWDATRFIASEPPTSPVQGEPPPPERVGAYRLTGRVGRGGMGDVYLGERDDGLFEQKVAAKLMRPSLFPLASAAFFDTERKALARLHHRGIAQIFDGGVDPEGRPWLVMELLDGQPIDERLRGADARRIARVMAEVCSAVQHAHLNLVVHADIKPSNVLVDAEDQPKLLDFGIAQMMAEPSDAAHSAFPCTPRYASAGRLRGERPVPADDIHALGVLLYELLAGQVWPEGEAARTPLRDRDLEAIVGRATAARAEDLYESAAALADDLKSWLELRPVRARAQTSAYVFSRYWRRRRWALSAAAAAAVSLVVALGVITGLYLESRAARAAAERRYADVRGMAKYLLFDVYDRLDRAPRTLAVRRDLARVGQDYLDQLAADRSAPADVQVEAARGLLRLAIVQGAPGRRQLGQVKEARANLARAQTLADALAAAHPERADIARLQAETRMERALFMVATDGEQAASRRMLEAARPMLDRAVALTPGDSELKRSLIDWSLRMSGQAQWEGSYTEAIGHGRTALAEALLLPPAEPRNVLLTARAYDAVAEAVYYGGDEAGSEAPYRLQMALLRALAEREPDDPSYSHAAARAEWALGSTLVGLERAGEALPILERGLARARANVAFDPQDEEARRLVRTLAAAHAQALSGVGRHDEAIALVLAQVAEREALVRTVRTVESERDLAVLLGSLGETYQDAGRRSDACAAYRRNAGALTAMADGGRLSGMDRDYTLRLAREGVAANC